jgi:hypothetical protein
MMNAIAARMKRGLGSMARGVRRGVVTGAAAIAMVVIYGLGSIGSYGLSVAGISGLALATSATKADARRRRHRSRGWNWRRRRRRGIWFGPRRRRRRRWRRRYMPRFGIYFGW